MNIVTPHHNPPTQSAKSDHASASGGSSIVQMRLGLEASTISIVISLMIVIAAGAVTLGLNLAEQQGLRREWQRDTQRLLSDQQEKHERMMADARERQERLSSDFRDLSVKYQLEERRKMDLEAYLMLHGWKRPADDTFGPTGNLQRMAKK